LKNKSLLILFLIFAILSVVNGYIFINRNNGYNYVESFDYRSLYGLKDQLFISNVEVLNDSAVISFSLSSEADEWVISSDNAKKYNRKGKLPSILLLNGLHNYTLENIRSGDKMFFTADYSSFSSTDSLKKNLFLVRSNIPLKNNGIHTLADWKYISKFSKSDEIEKIKKIIDDSIKVDNNSSTLKKIEKICLFLLNRLKDKKGTPDISLKTLSPYLQYMSAIDGKSKLWCENYAEIYLEFANAAGVPSRYVASNLKIGQKNYGGHVFAESFIKEQNRWAYIDLSSSKVYTLGIDSLVLNTVDIYNVVSSGGESKFRSLVYDNGELIFKPFDSVNSIEKYYFDRNSDLIFLFSKNDPGSLLSKLKNYFYPAKYYAYYAGINSQDNLKFYIKQIFLYLWALSVLVLVIVFLLRKIR
jgi:hypothetical protein